MKAVIDKITYVKEVQTKFGAMHQFRVEYSGKIGSFLSKSKDQETFKQGEENEFTETPREYQGNTYWNIKPIKKQGASNFGRAISKEQSRYSGFAASYAKDLVVAGKIEYDEILPTAEMLFNWMVEMDKELLNG